LHIKSNIPNWLILLQEVLNRKNSMRIMIPLKLMTMDLRVKERVLIAEGIQLHHETVRWRI